MVIGKAVENELGKVMSDLSMLESRWFFLLSQDSSFDRSAQQQDVATDRVNDKSQLSLMSSLCIDFPSSLIFGKWGWLFASFPQTCEATAQQHVDGKEASFARACPTPPRN
eukprot:1007276-Amphidinium_carterae.1